MQRWTAFDQVGVFNDERAPIGFTRCNLGKSEFLESCCGKQCSCCIEEGTAFHSVLQSRAIASEPQTANLCRRAGCRFREHGFRGNSGGIDINLSHTVAAAYRKVEEGSDRA